MSLGRIYNRRKKAEGAPAGNNNAKKQLDQNDPVVSTAEQVAAETGVSSATVKRAGKFAEEVAKAAYHIHRHQRTRSRRCQVARKPRGKGATFTNHRRQPKLYGSTHLPSPRMEQPAPDSVSATTHPGATVYLRGFRTVHWVLGRSNRRGSTSDRTGAATWIVEACRGGR